MDEKSTSKEILSDLAFYRNMFNTSRIFQTKSEDELNKELPEKLLMSHETYLLLIKKAEEDADRFRNELVEGLKKAMLEPEIEDDDDEPDTPEQIKASWEFIETLEKMSPREFGKSTTI